MEEEIQHAIDLSLLEQEYLASSRPPITSNEDSIPPPPASPSRNPFDSSPELRDRLSHPEIDPWEPPKDFLETGFALHDHQKTGVAWMMEREKPDSIFVQGGILMDEAGLGKTLTTLSLIKASPVFDPHADGKQRPTLIICPASLIEVWMGEIYNKFPRGSFRVYCYYDSSRKYDNVNTIVETFDVIVTSYGTLVSEWIKSTRDFIEEPPEGSNRKQYPQGSLFRKIFGRIVLDEAHNIRTRTCITSTAVTQLLATRFWCLTATPIHNKIDDLFPLFSFMSISPFSNDYEQWSNRIVKPIITRTSRGIQNLNQYLAPITLRRTKGLLNLPQIYIHEHIINLSEIEEDFYLALFYYSQERVKRILKFMEELKLQRRLQAPEEHRGDKRLREANSCLLTLILRLRQACVSPAMVINAMRRLNPSPSSDEEDDEGFTEYRLSQMPSQQQILEGIARLKFLTRPDATLDECSICMDDVASQVASPCNHICCEKCWIKLFNQEDAKCPFCRSTIDSYTPISRRIEELEHIEEEKQKLQSEIEHVRVNTIYSEQQLTNQGLSSKIQWILEHLKTHNQRALIVSQWTQALNLMQEQLSNHFPDEKFLRLDGSFTPIRRMQIVKQFQANADIRFCLISQHSSAEGITLTGANVVYFIDKWWNESKDYQTYNRTHRIGQSQDVHVHHLTAHNTIEGKIEIMRGKKRKISGIMTGDSTGTEEIPFANKVRLLFDITTEDQEIKKRRIGEVLPMLRDCQ